MPRRVTVPAAEDLFRRTGGGPAGASAPSEGSTPEAATDPAETPEPRPGPRAVPDPEESASRGSRRPSGRVRHDEKVTVYLTSAELVELEQARLTLRGTHGLAVDRGRLVREAVSLVLADLEAEGEQSALVQRLAEG